MAELQFTHGPMGAHKSAELLISAHNYTETGGAVLVTKPSKDTKADTGIMSRIGIERDTDFITTPDMDLSEEVLVRKNEMARLNALLIDEAQFLEPNQVDQIFALAVLHGIPVLTWGLLSDFRTHTFPGSRRLLELSHKIRTLTTSCAHGDGCVHDAQFNARRIDGVFVSQGDQVAIDGAGKVTYASLCATHYLEDVGPIQSA